MSTSRKILFNCEGLQSIPGINVTDASGNSIEVLMSGKLFHYISKNEESQELHNIIQANCDIRFCTESNTKGFTYYPVPFVMIFAYDSCGNYFGTLNGFGNIENSKFPVVFINKISGAYGKISEDVKTFFSLANYYPYWRTIMENEKHGTPYDLATLEVEQNSEENCYIERRMVIEETLNLSKDINAIRVLIKNLRDEPGFIVYETINEAEKKNEFIVL